MADVQTECEREDDRSSSASMPAGVFTPCASCTTVSSCKANNACALGWFRATTINWVRRSTPASAD